MVLYRAYAPIFWLWPLFEKWIQKFYKKIESCVLNNGWASSFFDLQRSVRQGCPLSPYLFILSAEILAKAIRSNKEIKGITIKKSEIKISQYPDNTTFILNGTKESLFATLNTIENFGRESGFRLNNRKTEALWIGSMAGNKEKLFPEKNFKWPENKVKFPGVWLTIDPSITLNMNYRYKKKNGQNKQHPKQLETSAVILYGKNPSNQKLSGITTNLYLSTVDDKSQNY